MRLTVRDKKLLNASTGRPLPTMPAAADPERRVTNVNRWRDQYNPLRGLTLSTAIAWLEQCQRGIYCDFQWACSFIERRDPDLSAIIERRCGMLSQMDFDIKTVEKRFQQRGQAFDTVLAAEQRAMLRGEYDRIDNLYEAIDHLEMGAFWGYAPVQYIADGAILRQFNLLDPWNITRDGLHGDWYWNPEADTRAAKSLPAENRLDLRAYIMRIHRRPINEFALIKYLRQNLSSKDWDGFLEIYGIPGWIVIMPPNVPDNRRSEYEDAAQGVAEGGSGALPHGSDAKCADQPRGVSPFQEHLQYWSERLVLSGTGGLLTMLTAPDSGTLAGSAHWQAFEIIARSEARKVSELMQRTVDRHLLAQHFPGRAALAYFELAANEEQDVGDIIDQVVKITSAGGQVDWSEISEKVGLNITQGTLPAAQAYPPQPGAAPFYNRLSGRALANRDTASGDPLIDTATEQALAADREDVLPLAERIADILEETDPEKFIAAVTALQRDLPGLTPELLRDPRVAAVIEGATAAGILTGATARGKTAAQPERKERVSA